MKKEVLLDLIRRNVINNGHIKKTLALMISALILIPVETKASQMSPEEISEEMEYDELGLLAQLVQAEAGNQDLTGMRYVVDVVLNRVDSEEFPDTISEVIFQEDQFSVIKNGAFDEAGWNMSDEAFEAVWLEYESRSNCDILYFNTAKPKYAKKLFKHQDHWFGC